MNNATCRDWRDYYTGNYTYMCNCALLYTGQNCETALPDPCAISACQNNGSCSPRRTWKNGKTYVVAQCNCVGNFGGSNCEREMQTLNICPSRRVYATFGYILSPNYPQNYPNNKICELEVIGGQGFNQLNYLHFEKFYVEDHRTCKFDYLEALGLKYCGMKQGTTIRTERTDKFTVKFKSDSSQARSGFKVKFEFSKVETPCSSSPCMNNATCHWGSNGGYWCNCQRLYTGQKCETKLEDPCDSNPCEHGSCRSYQDYFSGNMTHQCSCDRGYTGKNCETSIPPTPCELAPCHNNGSCHDWKDYRSGNWSYSCSCLIEFTGRNCEHRVANPCDSNPCVNGRCQKTYNYRGPQQYISYQCNCFSKYTGRNCETIPDQVFSVCPTRRVHAESGYVISPNYPAKYSRNTYCELTVVGTKVPNGEWYAGNHNNRLAIKSTESIDLENHNYCTYDYLFVTGWGPKQCGRKSLNKSNLKETTAKFIFRSDSSGQRKGFKLHFQFTKVQDEIYRGDAEAPNAAIKEMRDVTIDEDGNDIENDAEADEKVVEDFNDEIAEMVDNAFDNE